MKNNKLTLASLNQSGTASASGTSILPSLSADGR